MQSNNKILISIAFVFALVTLVLLIAWKTGPFLYHFAELGLVTLYSLLQLLATAYLSFLACRSLERDSSLKWQKNPAARPFFIAAIGFLFLGLDEILSLHKNIDKLIHLILFLKETTWTDHIDDFIVLAYGLVALYFIKDFIREFKKRPFMVISIIGGFILFFIMSWLDFATNNLESFEGFFFKDMLYGDLLYKRDIFRMIEDSVKLLGEAFFLSAFVAAYINIKVGMNFKEKVLEKCKLIPKGKITTYKIIAEKLGTKAYRAVGSALRNNKKPIIIPCHRVVNSNGTVGGYKGIKNNKEKIRLLRKEGVKIKKNKINLKKYLFKF